MKTLILCLLSIGGLLAQSTPPNQLQIYSPAPSPVRQIGGGTVGQSGSTTLYYWVIARYSSGIAANTTPVAIFNTVGTANLTASNYVAISWGAVSGATGYDVLRSTTPIYPSNPTCTGCAVVLNTPNASVNDTGAALSNYPPAGLVQASSVTATLYLDNGNSVPYFNVQLLYRATENLIMGLVSGPIADGDCIEYSAGRLVSAGAGCGSGGGLGDPGSNGIVVRTALNTTVARTLQEGTNITITYPDGVSGNPVINASAGGSANTPFAPSRETTSTTNDTIRLNCDAAPYCAIRINGVAAFTLTADITMRVSGASVGGSQNAYIYYDIASQTVYCDENTTSTLTVSGCTAAATGGIPAGAVPLGKYDGTYPFTSLVFDNPATSPVPPAVWTQITNGAGVVCTANGSTGDLVCATDTNTIPTIANTRAGAYISLADSSASTTTYTGCPSPAIASYTSGMPILFKPNSTNTGSSTLNVCTIGAVTIQKLVSGTLTNLASGDMDSDAYWWLAYNGTVFVMSPLSGGSTETPSQPAFWFPGGYTEAISSAQVISTAANDTVFNAFVPDVTMDLRTIAFYVATGSGTCGGTCGLKIGIYDTAGTTILAQTATMTSGGSPDINSTGLKSATFTSTASLTKGTLYWIAFTSDSTALATYSYLGSSSSGLGVDLASTLIGSEGFGYGTDGSGSGAAVALPASKGAVTRDVSKHFYVGFKY